MLQKPSFNEAKAGLAAIKMIFTSQGKKLEDWHKEFFEALKKYILKVEINIDSLAPITEAELAQAFTNDVIKKQFLSGLITATLLNGEINLEQNAILKKFAAALKIEVPALKVFGDLAKKHYFLARLDFMRNSHIKRGFLEHNENHTLLDTLLTIGRSFGLISIVDKKLSEKYLALEYFPNNSLGHDYFLFIRKNGFSFPGEPGCLPEEVSYHDLCHVLLGYGTDPEGETLISAFHAGHMKEGLLTAMMTLCQFSLGIRLLPARVPTVHGTIFGPDMFAKWFAAIEKGSKLNVDLSDHWNFWDVLDQPTEAVRKLYNIVPITG